MDAVDELWVSPAPAAVPTPLKPFVRTIAGYAARGLEPGVHRGLPGHALTLVLALDAPLRVAATQQHWSVGDLVSLSTVLGGLHTEPAFIAQPGRWAGIQLDVHPLGARRLFGVPAAALPVASEAVPDLLGAAELDAVEGRLQEVTSWSARYAVVTDWLLDRLAASEAGRLRRDVVEAWRRLESRHGAVRVDDLAGHVGLSRRRLERLFTAELGVTPKIVARLIRFDGARRDVRSAATSGGPSLDLSGIAARRGYYDHGHLVREFTGFTGLSPTGWLAAEAANVQAGAPAPG